MQDQTRKKLGSGIKILNKQRKERKLKKSGILAIKSSQELIKPFRHILHLLMPAPHTFLFQFRGGNEHLIALLLTFGDFLGFYYLDTLDNSDIPRFGDIDFMRITKVIHFYGCFFL